MYRQIFLILVSIPLFVFSTTIADESDETIYHLIRCDDMGMCHALNMAIEKVIKAKIPVSVSVMFACPWYQEAVDILKEHPEVSVGIHLTLNAEWKNYRWGPVSGRESVPSLVNSNGYFFPSRTRLFANNPQVSEIEYELRAQLERAAASGIRLDYLDYHMGAAVQTEELRQLVEGLAREYQLAIPGYFGEKYSNITYHASLGDKADSLLAHVRSLQPGLNLQVVHVGLDVPEMQALIDLNPSGPPSMSEHRQEELESLLNPELKVLWKKNSIQPITYRQLIERFGLDYMKRPQDDAY